MSGLANKTTTGRMLDTLTFFNSNHYHCQTVRKAFHHFLSLTSFTYDFYCYRCGYHPAVVISDANWKLAFDVPVGTFKRPAPDIITEKDLETDIEKSWSELDKFVIAEGLLSGTMANPYFTSMHHSNLAPWMGKRTRVGDILPKTEVNKGLKRRQEGIKVQPKNINENSILELLESKKPSKKELQDACLTLGVSSEGSITDLINRLEELLNFKEVYPKLFLKLQKAGGGVLHFSCMHGVVYYVNFLFWSESARDHADGLLSFKHFPTCYISDVAGQVAKHTNNRTKQLYFQPHDGRLCEPNAENIQLATRKELQVDMEWIKRLKCPLLTLTNTDVDRLTATHPITQTSERYSLYDRFHQKNQRRPEEKLRSLNICPSLRTEINSAVAEQLNRELSSVKYSLCQMNEVHFRQTVRLLIELHNYSINTHFKTKMEGLCKIALSVGLTGMLGLQSSDESVSQPTCQPAKPPEIISSFKAQQYTIIDSHMAKLKALCTGIKKESQVLTHATRRFPLQIKDVYSVCPPELLVHSSMAMPWLTDDAVNYRVAQLATENKCGSLATYDFILWHREWTKSGTTSDDVSKRIPASETLFLPRIVGHESPETGNHFILWVFDFKAKQVRIYDSLGLYKEIFDKDMDLLRNVFRFSGGLQDWTVTYPPQWTQQDYVNCGVLVCSAAENEVLHHKMSMEALTLNQCKTLRLHHATPMLKDISSKV